MLKSGQLIANQIGEFCYHIRAADSQSDFRILLQQQSLKSYWTRQPTAVSLMLATSQYSSVVRGTQYSVGSSSKALITSCSPPFCNTSRRSCSVSEKFHSRLKQCICNVICSLFNSFSRPLSASDSLSLDFPKCFLERDLNIKRNSRIPAIYCPGFKQNLVYILCVGKVCCSTSRISLLVCMQMASTPGPSKSSCKWCELQLPTVVNRAAVSHHFCL